MRTGLGFALPLLCWLRRSWLLLCLALAAAGLAHGQVPRGAQPSARLNLTPQEHAWLAAHPVIRIGVDPGYAPYAFVDGDGRFAGLAAEFSDEVSSLLGVRFDMVPGLSWRQIVDGARRKTVDVITTAAHTPERDAFLHFTRIYIPTPLVIMTREDEANVRVRADLIGRRVALVRGYSSAQRATQELPGMNVVWVDEPLAGLRAVATGDVDAYIGVLGVNVYLAQQTGLANLKVAAEFDAQTNGQRYGVRKDWPELAAILDKALDAISDERKAAMMARWVPVKSQVPTHPPLLSASELRWLAAHPRVRVGVVTQDAPFEFLNKRGDYAGIASDYAEQLRKATGLSLDIVPFHNREELFAQASQGNVDMVIGKSASFDRQQYLNFSKPLYTSSLLIYVREGSTPLPRAASDLAGQRVAVRAGTAADMLIARDYAGLLLVRTPSTEASVLALAQRQVDAMIDEVLSTSYVLERHSDVKLQVAAALPDYPLAMRFGVRKDWPELVSIVNKVLASITVEDHAAIRSAWLGPVARSGWPVRTVVAWSMAALVLVLLGYGALYWWNNGLRAEIARHLVLETELREASQYKSEFLAKVSHEIRTPINVILGVAHLLNKTRLDARQDDYLQKIRTASRSLLDVINDILDLSKIESGKLTLESIGFDLDLLLDDLHALMSVQALEKGLRLHLVVDPAAPVKLVGDPTRLRQVLLNLLSNAIKFTESGRVVIHLRADHVGDESAVLTFDVQDTGIGIAPDKLATVFDPYVQAEAATSREHGGSGLGLSIARNLVAQMGGELRVSSEPGRGSRFFFTLRYHLDTQGEFAPVRDGVISGTDRLVRSRVLIADDNRVTGEMMREVLAAEGVTTLWVKSGQDAVEAIRQAPWDIVLMDVQMPGMDGMAATRAIRDLPHGRSVPVIAVTAMAQPQDREDCLSAGMNDFLAKPVDPTRLLTLLLHWVDPPAHATEVPARAAAVLDAERGLLRVGGNAAVYATLLRNFVDDHRGDAAEVDQCLRRRDRSQLLAVLHPLRGAAATIEAHLLEAACRRLMRAMDDELHWPAHADVRGLESQIQQLVNAVEAHLLRAGAQAPRSQSVLPGELAAVRAQLDQLQAWLRVAYARAQGLSRALVPGLAAVGYGETARKMTSLLDNFEFEHAMQLAAELVQALRQSNETEKPNE